ncbi:MAG: YodC family protein, partial [Candidatus Obscuribacterales bacterium]|nr:YodC family protein [Candidatus Obscuribacterales bacterium]
EQREHVRDCRLHAAFGIHGMLRAVAHAARPNGSSAAAGDCKMKIGDIVRLKSGGPAMTVTFVSATEEEVDCMFFDNSNCMCEASDIPCDAVDLCGEK